MSETITSIDLSNKGLTEIPEELLEHKDTLEILDISNNNFTDLKPIAEFLSQFPKLINLNIDLESEEDALLILKSIQNLKILNQQATDEENEDENNNDNNNNNNGNDINNKNELIKEENDKPLRQSELNENNENENNKLNEKLDDNQMEIPEVQNASLQSEINNFNDIVSNIKKVYENKPDEVNKFSDEFQDFLKNKIDYINQMVNTNTAKYLYSLNVYQSKLDIYSFLNQKINSILKELSSSNNFNNSNLIIDSLEKIEQFRTENEKIINSIVNKMNKGITELNTNRKNDNNELNKQLKSLNEELNKLKKKNKEYEMTTKTLQMENKSLNEKNKLLKKDNDKLSGNLFRRANRMIRTETNGNKENNEFLPDSKNNNIFDIKSLFENPHEKITLSQNNSRVLAKNTLIELINDIYKNKIISDKKNMESKIPKFTMEQHLFNYLKSKYGLKKLIVEWSIKILNGIKLYSKENAEICLFGLLLRNELDENYSIQILNKIKETVKKLIKELVNNFQKYENIINGNTYMDETLWKTIANILYKDDIKFIEQLIQKIEDFIESKIENVELLIQMGKKILFNDFLNLVIMFNLNIRKNYLENLVEMFREVDDGRYGIITGEGFVEIIQRANLYNQDNIESKVQRLLEIVDENEFNNIRFTDVVDAFDKEYVEDENGKKIKILDKIALAK